MPRPQRQGNRCPDDEGSFDQLGLEPVFAQLDNVVARIDGGDHERSIWLNRPYRSLVGQDGSSRNSPLDRQRSESEDGLQIERQSALLALADPDPLIRNFLEAALGHSYHVLFEFEIRNAQLPALRQSRLNCAVEENSRFVLAGNYDQRAQILSRFKAGTQRGYCSRVRVEFVAIFIAAAGHRQFVRADGNGGKFYAVAR